MKRLVYLLPVFLLLTACKPYKQRMQEKIKEQEIALKKDFDSEKAGRLIEAYDYYIQEYPKDTMSRNYIFRAANTLVTMGDGEKAIQYFDRFMEEYPNDGRAPNCMFTKAFTYDTVLKDKANAVKYYSEFIKAYPDHELADDAANAMLLLQDPLELIRNFEAQNDSVPVEQLP